MITEKKSGAKTEPGTVSWYITQHGDTFKGGAFLPKMAPPLEPFWKTVTLQRVEPFFFLNMNIKEKNGSTLRSGTVFQNEPFLVHFFFLSDGL